GATGWGWCSCRTGTPRLPRFRIPSRVLLDPKTAPGAARFRTAKANATNGRAQSDVQRAAVCGEDRFVHRFGDRRVREDGLHKLGLCGLESLAHGEALDPLAELGADHVRAG